MASLILTRDIFEDGVGAAMAGGYHSTPTAPGYSAEIKESVFEEFECPNGTFWASELGQEMINDKWRGVMGMQTSKIHKGSEATGAISTANKK